MTPNLETALGVTGVEVMLCFCSENNSSDSCVGIFFFMIISLIIRNLRGKSRFSDNVILVRQLATLIQFISYFDYNIYIFCLIQNSEK